MEISEFSVLAIFSKLIKNDRIHPNKKDIKIANICKPKCHLKNV